MRICLFLGAAASLWLSSCSGMRSEVQDEVAAEGDTLVAEAERPDDADSVELAAPAPPKTADLLFDDFIYGFMRSRNFQLQRIVFPLPCIKDGVSTSMARESWRFDRLYARSDVYMMIFDGQKKTGSPKDLKVKHVSVEMLDFGEQRIRRYVFDKLDGSWMLTRIDECSYEEHADGDFYTFYQRFAADEEFQQEHLASSIVFRTFDDDSFEHIEGTLTPEQWADFRPDLPAGRIANIDYGRNNPASDTRVVVLASVSAGMNCTLTFHRSDCGWTLCALEN
ncbi:MAG: DUF4348 domain-containing protein [Prevotellaceae bacterium]|nr:DUF4348 domain-containing protein [Prevotellaceae bacterium]